MHRRHRPHTSRRTGQTVSGFTSNGISQIAVDICYRQGEAFGVGNRHAAQPLRIFIKTRFAFFDHLRASANRGVNQLVRLF